MPIKNDRLSSFEAPDETDSARPILTVAKHMYRQPGGPFLQPPSGLLEGV